MLPRFFKHFVHFVRRVTLRDERESFVPAERGTLTIAEEGGFALCIECVQVLFYSDFARASFECMSRQYAQPLICDARIFTIFSNSGSAGNSFATCPSNVSVALYAAGAAFARFRPCSISNASFPSRGIFRRGNAACKIFFGSSSNRGKIKEWWAWVDLNYRPRPYQGRALAT
jgi:hypothetical protein